MTLEAQVAALTTAANGLTAEVTGKMASIDAKVAQAQIDFNNLTPEKRITTDITIGGDVNYLYPVWWFMLGGSFGESKITVHREYILNRDEPVALLVGMQDGIHVGSLLLELEGLASGWSGDNSHLQIKRYGETYGAQLCSHVHFLMVADAASSTSASANTVSGIYLRGGGLTYHITHNGGLVNLAFDDGSAGINNLTNIHTDATNHWNVKPIPLANIQVPVASILPGFISV